MTNLVNHPGKWLRKAAADSLARFEAKHGIISVNSAGRTVGEQQDLINRYDAGGTFNRPPYLFNPFRPAEKGNHVINGGQAIDTNHTAVMLKYGKKYGWYHLYDYDIPHFEYIESKDKMKPKPGAKPKFSKTWQNRQIFLNKFRGEKLKTDGFYGPATKAAVQRYQRFLKKYFSYGGSISGKYGVFTRSASKRYQKSLAKK